MDGCKKSATSAGADLTDDLIVEILSRLPAKSICRFKCVSRHWYGLITHPERRKKIPQTLSGFFHPSYRLKLDNEDLKVLPGFVGIMESEELPFLDSSLPFVTGYRSIIPKVCSNGLLFCLCWKVAPRDEADFVVCNPATEKWVVLPEPDTGSIPLYYLFGFDPAISPPFPCV